MVKSKVTNRDETNPLFKYPGLGISDQGLIVVFTAPGEGTVLAVGSTGHNIGYHSKSWARDSFKPFDKAVTLQND